MRARAVVLAGAGMAGLFFVALVVLGTIAASASLGGATPTPTAIGSIPPTYLSLYQAAAGSCPGLPWSVLAGIGRVESDHGHSTAPGVASGANPAGAAGPMQLGVGGKAGNTFAQYGVDADGGGADVHDPADAIFTAANYLCQHGARGGADLHGAVFAYNHAESYVTKVLQAAQAYAAGGMDPLATGRAVSFAYAQLGTPYQWGGDGENGTFDCSGLTMAAWAAAGVTLPHNSAAQYASAGPHIPDPSQLLPGDLVYFAHNPSDPATIHHVGMYIGNGQMLEAPHTGAVVRISNVFVRPDYIGATRPSG